jgi:hypothetical protein
MAFLATRTTALVPVGGGGVVGSVTIEVYGVGFEAGHEVAINEGLSAGNSCREETRN